MSNSEMQIVSTWPTVSNRDRSCVCAWFDQWWQICCLL